MKPEDQTGPLPNLAKSWEWNAEMTELTMHLVEGVKWSDGDAFDTEDIASGTTTTSRIQTSTLESQRVIGGGAKLEVIDAHTFKFVFPAAQSNTVVEGLAYIQGCPGPSHILKESHPRYNSAATYDGYLNAAPADKMAGSRSGSLDSC